MKKKKRENDARTARSERRTLERRSEKIARDREKLALLERGGAPDRPLPVGSASVIEVHAQSMPCLHCETPYRVEEHEAKRIGGRDLRVVHVKCPQCGSRRVVYFEIVPTALN